MKVPAGLWIYIILLSLFTGSVYAQSIQGVVVDASDSPVAGVSVYIEEIRQGLLSDHEGRFLILLDIGTYTFISKKIGYKTQRSEVEVTPEGTDNITITLEENTLHNPVHKSKKESNTLASDIIRNAITKAPLYANSVDYYSAYSYLNGNLRIRSIPDIIDKISYKIQKYHLLTLRDETFVQEIYNKIEFSNPDYKITEEASSGNIPQSINYAGAIDALDGSIYLKRFNESISPVNPDALSYYRYKYAGYYVQDKQILHKIKVEPRLNDPELVKGDIYISDSSWHIEYAKISSRIKGLKQVSEIVSHNLEDNVHLPVSYLIELEFNELGISADATYYMSMKYDSIIVHKNIDETDIIPSLSDDNEATLLTQKGDSAFWNSRRTMPVINMDSLNNYLTDSIQHLKERYHPSNFWFGKIILGGYIFGNDTTKWSARYNGMKMIFRDYNYVDGFWLGNKFQIRKRLTDNKLLRIDPYIYYTTARHRFLGGADLMYDYAPKKRGTLTFSSGSRSEDFNSLTVTRYQNYFSSLVLGENYNSFYQRDYVTASNDIYLTSRLRMSASIGIERRSGLSNNTDFNILNRHHIKPNIFPDDRFDRTFYSAGISYSPFSNYLITKAFDVHNKQISPIFHLEYEEGFSSWQTNNSKYRKVKGGVIHNIQLNYFNKIDYKIESGFFLSKRNMHFIDYQHFGASDLLINLNSLFDSFLLLDNYELETNRYWVNVFLNYSGKYVLLKFIPFLQGKPFTENIHIKTLFTPDVDSYVELGYSVSITRNMGIGAFGSFQNTKAKKFGIRFSFDLSSLGIM